MSDVLEKAGELADAITACPEINKLKAAEVVMGQDAAAQEIIAEFTKLQGEFQQTIEEGKELSADQEAARDALEVKMEANSSIKSYFDAQQAFEGLLQSVNMLIGRAISGDSECGSDCGSDCGPGCDCSSSNSCGCS